MMTTHVFVLMNNCAYGRWTNVKIQYSQLGIAGPGGYKATSPALHDDDWDAIAAFCDQVNKELEGPQIAVRLLAHKIQSPTEREALSALSTIESCVKQCGVPFHKEIGKFRFLNEIIKILSPKFLGNRMTERVKKRCIELLYSWHKGLPHETKIADAYKMLKDQHIIKEDPTYMDKTFELFPPPKPRTADFEDEERAKELNRLLKSKKAEDLKAANKLIKELVKEDTEKSEKRSRRIRELETINNLGKQLTKMVKQYNPSSDRSQFEAMKGLYEDLAKKRPQLFKLAGETEEQETDAMNEILAVNDEVTKAMLLYMKKIEGSVEENGQAEGAVKDSSLLDLRFDSQGQQIHSSSQSGSGASSVLQSEFQNLGLSDSPPAASPFPNLGSLFAANQQQQQQQAGRMSLVQAAMGAPGAEGFLPAQNRQTGTGVPTTFLAQSNASGMLSATAPAPSQSRYYAASQEINASLTQPSVFSASTSASAATVATFSAAAAAPAAMADLDALGQSLLEKNRTKDFVRPPAGPPPKLTMNQLAAAKTAPCQEAQPLQPQAPLPSLSILDAPLQPSPVSCDQQNSVLVSGGGGGTHTVGPSLPVSSMALSSDSSVNSAAPLIAPVSSSQDLLPLTDIFVPLESITPGDVPPMTVYDKNSLKSMIHFSKNRPRPDVLVMVLSTLSTNVKPIKSLIFQAAVPRVMKIKLQPPSALALPAFNPIVPPMAITQVMLIANPHKEKIRLKFKISYILGEEPVSDGGDVEDFPVQ
ncbi:ADP-ribosylation factor-binding protein GGA1-like isoform X3 [Babylonia areolata]|uniref:ADP-ribosylation factor-binding protein GGA1-like isoform X3 n=1 Tax=Babylonia areolata TaxID=304850 RepID=UPI003FD58A6F